MRGDNLKRHMGLKHNEKANKKQKLYADMWKKNLMILCKKCGAAM